MMCSQSCLTTTCPLEGHSGLCHDFLSLEQDRGDLVIACVAGRWQTSFLLLPGFWPKMGGTVTIWAPHLPEGASWWVWRFAGTVARHASQKVTAPVFPVTSVEDFDCLEDRQAMPFQGQRKGQSHQSVEQSEEGSGSNF
jgi:hypothetical protein